MFALADVEHQLTEVISGLDAAALDGAGAVELVDGFARLERLAAAGLALTTARVEASDVWRGEGARDAIGFVAARTNTNRGRIRDGLAVANQTGSLPQLDRALRAGELTIDQAADITAAASEHPEAESELVAMAATLTRRQLKARCVEILAQGDGAEEQHRRARKERTASSSTGRDGIWRMSARLPIIDGAFIDKALDFFQTQIFDDARARGDRDPYDAYRADALVAMARAAMGQDCTCDRATDRQAIDDDNTGSDDDASTTKKKRRRRRRRSSSTRHAIVITVPHNTFLTGQPTNGETCQIPGVGPVPISVVHQLMNDDPIIKAIVTNGRDITSLTTISRSLKDDLRLAVLATHDLTCGVPDCDHTRFLELDHQWQFHKGGPTSYHNLRPLCSFHHRQRTLQGYELRGQPGSYEWVDPNGNILSTERSTTPTPTAVG